MPLEDAQTLRDTIASAVEATETPETPAVVPEVEPSQDRPRDEQGRFVAVEKKEEKPEVVAAPPEKPFPNRPSSWKKEHWGIWDKLSQNQPFTPEEARLHAEYVNQREGEYAKGVSTYKQEFERLRPLDEAMQQFTPLLQQHNIEPVQWITNLGNAHRMLALGTPEQKLGMFVKLAQDYRIPLEQLFVQREGQVYLNQNLPTPQAQQPDVGKLVEQKFTEWQTRQAIQNFESAKDASGNPRYPHYEQVKATMAQFLESGLADDLESAYLAALRHPRHAEIFEADQEQKRAQDEAEAKKKAAAEAERARRNAVSVRGQTPAAPQANGNKGLRAHLSEEYDKHVAGRV